MICPSFVTNWMMNYHRNPPQGYNQSGQIIATSHDLTPNGGLVREIPLFQGNLSWWNIIIWPDQYIGDLKPINLGLNTFIFQGFGVPSWCFLGCSPSWKVKLGITRCWLLPYQPALFWVDDFHFPQLGYGLVPWRKLDGEWHPKYLIKDFT